jgi:CelD/BcsL family acetyltransferase involved in cellulose biosynthesis
MELIIAGFHSDPQFAKYSPGIVLDEFWMKIAFERRQDVDFGVGSERYKLFWSRNNKVDVASYHIPQTLVGNITTQLWHLNRRAAPYVARHMRPFVDPAKNPSAPPS